MAPLVIVALGAGVTGLAAWAYEKYKGGGGAPWGGWSQPPSVPGYTPPPAPAGTPPSWTYQGPQIPPATSTNVVEALNITPGTMTSRPKPGDTIVASLPAGATWAATDPTLVPTCIGGDLTGASAGGADPLSITGVNGAGTAQLNWVDSSGMPQQSLLDINTGSGS